MKQFTIIVLLFFFINSLVAQTDSSINIDRISDCSVFLYQPTSDTSGDTGTGTIVNMTGKYFILTASHVAKTLTNTSKVVFHLPGDKPGIVDLSQLTGNNANWQMHPVADIAILQIFPPKGELLKWVDSIAFPMNHIHKGDLPSRDFEFTFLGYPFLDLQLEHFSPLTFESHLASGLMTGIRADTKKKSTFFYLDKPSIQGCSGSGVFISIKKLSIYQSAQKTYLIGIMHGTYSDNTGGKLAAVTPLSYLNNWNVNVK